ncbi:hypothetical protein QZH41_014585 [Actinostola sp. cb2023]|nr:hypothetical protein QZH41_014585 [Actinostola sp. cb2023]
MKSKVKQLSLNIADSYYGLTCKMADQTIYKTLRLHISPDKFYIEPRDPTALGDKILEIDRVTQELNLADNEGQIPPSAETKDIFGIMGIIHLLAGPYLIVITRKRLVGYIQGNEVWKVLGTEVLPFPRALLHLNEDQVYYNKLYLSMVTSVLQTDGFYFSCSYDLTHTVQRLSRTSPEFLQMPLFERVGQENMWIQDLYGIIIFCDHSQYNQRLANPFTHYITVTVIEETLGFQYHIDNQIAHYGELVLVNLIDQKPPEKILGDNFSSIVRNSGYPEEKLRYDAFDFHKECSKMRWDRLNILIDRLNNDLKKLGYCSLDRDTTINTEQKGVFRTNCIDSLDRTNVVQSMLATKSLELQLEECGVITTGERIADHKEFEFVFKNVWADNADACSVQYAGTGALKTDFTRTGKRSVLGALKDGLNSAIRYYKNNFSDGYRQDSIDLFLGNYVVDSNECVTKPCPLQQRRDWRYLMLPFILLFGFSMFIISLILPSTDYGIQFLYVLFWGAAVLLTLYIVVFFGTEFVDQPKLLQSSVKDKHV